MRLPPSWADTAEPCLGIGGGGVCGDSPSLITITSSLDDPSLSLDGGEVGMMALGGGGVGMLVLCLGLGGGTLTAGICAGGLPLIPPGGFLVCGGTGGALGGAHGV